MVRYGRVTLMCSGVFHFKIKDDQVHMGKHGFEMRFRRVAAGFNRRMDPAALAMGKERPGKLPLKHGFTAGEGDAAVGAVPEGPIRFDLLPERFDIYRIAAKFDRIGQANPGTEAASAAALRIIPAPAGLKFNGGIRTGLLAFAAAGAVIPIVQHFRVGILRFGIGAPPAS